MMVEDVDSRESTEQSPVLQSVSNPRRPQDNAVLLSAGLPGPAGPPDIRTLRQMEHLEN